VGDARGPGGSAVAAGCTAPAVVNHHRLTPVLRSAAAAGAVGHRAAAESSSPRRSDEDEFGFSGLGRCGRANQLLLGPWIRMGRGASCKIGLGHSGLSPSSSTLRNVGIYYVFINLIMRLFHFS
jgi:hypothetical protein